MTALVELSNEATSPTAVSSSGPVMAVQTLGLNAYFGDTHAVRDVTLDVPPNEVTAIIGPSGCGKSTLLRCLNRMHETIPRTRVEGRVLLHEQDIYADDVDPITLRRHVGMVFQRPTPFPTMSIRDNAAAGARAPPRPRRSARDRRRPL